MPMIFVLVLFDWKSVRAFEDLKQAVIDDLVLQLSDHTKPIEVNTDASDFVTSNVLVVQ